MWRAAAIFLVILPAAGMIGWWLFYRRWSRTPLGQARRKAAAQAEERRLEEAMKRLRDDPRRNGSGTG